MVIINSGTYENSVKEYGTLRFKKPSAGDGNETIAEKQYGKVKNILIAQ
jgi:hypothetical protein